MNNQILIAFILFSNILVAQVSIKVLNNKFEPIENATIFYDTLIFGKTNNEGVCYLNKNNYIHYFIRCVGYKSKKLMLDSLNKSYTVFLEDSIFMLDEIIIKNINLESVEIGSKLTNKFRWDYSINVEGLMGSKIPIKKENFKIDEISFFVVDYKLPDTVSFVEVKVCSCPVANDTLNRKHYLNSSIVKLNKKKSWYTIKYPLQEQKFITTNCLFVEFDMVYHPGIEEFMKNPVETQKNNYIFFGLENKPNGIITYSYASTLLSNSSYKFRPEWNKIHQPQKLILKLKAIKTN